VHITLLQSLFLIYMNSLQVNMIFMSPGIKFHTLFGPKIICKHCTVMVCVPQRKGNDW